MLRRKHVTAARRAVGRELPLPDGSSFQAWLALTFSVTACSTNGSSCEYAFHEFLEETPRHDGCGACSVSALRRPRFVGKSTFSPQK